jgi:glucose/arabinose dehydrogenase
MRSLRIVALLVFVIAAATEPIDAATTPLGTVRVASGLTRPIFATHVPGDQNRLFIVEQGGLIKILNLQSGMVLGTPFLDLTSTVSCCGDQGLYAVAFHPSYASNGLFFVTYTNAAGDSELARYQVMGDPGTSNVADPSSASILLTITELQASHNIGWIAFGPNDGYLYVAKGDGGFSCDPNQQAQDLSLLHGKILRLDVDSGSPYGIPPDNPFVGVAGADEVWVYGVRNPWRNSFDPATGDLFIADVGQLEREEIDFQPASSGGGENYGWDCMEGTECSTVSGCAVGGCTCGAPGLVPPIHEYDHTVGCSITGGEVYGGSAITDLAGTYFFADFCNDQVWSFRYDGVTISDFVERTTELDPGGGLTLDWIVSFGRDAAGELYICDLFGGEVFQIVGTPACGDGVVDDGEACDDGSFNGTDHSCCQSNCQHKPDGPTGCDGNPCTRTDACTSGTCTSGPCADGSACTFCGGMCTDTGSSCDCIY